MTRTALHSLLASLCFLFAITCICYEVVAAHNSDITTINTRRIHSAQITITAEQNGTDAIMLDMSPDNSESAEAESNISYPLTEDEINLIALVVMGEAEGEPELGKRLVIDTILNRVDDTHFPDTVNEVVYQPNQFSVMWCERINRCYVKPEIVELVKEELMSRTNTDVIFFKAGGYSKYGKPMFKECCHYFSSYA